MLTQKINWGKWCWPPFQLHLIIKFSLSSSVTKKNWVSQLSSVVLSSENDAMYAVPYQFKLFANGKFTVSTFAYRDGTTALFWGGGWGGGDAYVQHVLLIDNHTTIVTPYKIVFRSALSVDFFLSFIFQPHSDTWSDSQPVVPPPFDLFYNWSHKWVSNTLFTGHFHIPLVLSWCSSHTTF